MTALSRQLEQLALPYVKSAFASDKRKKSLLFDPKEAATLDRETIFALGSNGLEELEVIDATFQEFEETLFNESSQDWERSLQTADVNEKLDTSIREFLVKLSPYLLIKSAHKALEWLIYRYHIHQMNVDDVMLCILPYHQSNIFTRMLQIMEISDRANKWNWLLQVQKSGVTLSRLSLINHSVQDVSFLSFICEFPAKHIKVHGPDSEQLRTVVSFFTCTLLGTLQNKHDISEKILSVLVPNIVRGLKSKCKSYKAATYMILSQLAVQTKLKDDFMSSLVPILTKHVDADLSTEMLVCLTILFQTQKIGKLPKRSFNHLSKLPGLVENISSLSARYDMNVFISAYLHRLVPKGIKMTAESASSGGEASDSDLLSGVADYTALLTGLLQGVHLPASVALDVSSELLLSLLALRAEKSEEEWREVANVLLSIMERKYSLSLDEAVENTLCMMTSEEERAALNDILRVTSSAVKYQMVTDDSTTLYLGLHHTRSSLRTLAVEQLASNLRQNLKLPEGFAEGTLIARLRDDSPSVVEAVLKMKEDLLGVFSRESLVSELIKLLQRSFGQPEWLRVTTAAIDLLTNSRVAETSSPDVAVLPLLPFVLVRHLSDEFLQPARVVMSSQLAQSSALLKTMARDWRSALEKAASMRREERDKALAHVNGVFIRGLVGALHAMKPAKRLQTVEAMCASSGEDESVKLICAVVCCELAVQCRDAHEWTSVLKPLLDLLLAPTCFRKTEVATGYAAGEDLMPCMGLWVAYLHKHDKLHIDLLVWVLDRLLTHLPAVVSKMKNKDMLWWDVDSELVACVTRILDTVMTRACDPQRDEEQVRPWRHLLKFQDTMKAEHLCKLLCVICTWPVSAPTRGRLRPSPTLQVASLHFINNLLRSHASPIFIKNTPVLETLLVNLVHPARVVREAAASCAQTVRATCGKQLPQVGGLLKKICRRTEEIAADAEFLPLIIKKLSESEEYPDMSCVHVLLTWVENPTTPPHTLDTLLRCVEFAPDEIVVERSLPVVDVILELCESRVEEVREAHVGVLEQVMSRVSGHVTGQSLSTLLQCLRIDVRIGGAKSPQTIALEQMTKALFRSLPGVAEQKRVVSAVLDVAEKTDASDVLNSVQKTLRHLKLDGAHVAHELTASNEEPKSQTVKQKRRRSKRTSEDGVTSRFSWRRATILLEALQTRRSVHDPQTMLSLLFALLTELLGEEGEDLEYRKRLVLSCIHNITKQWPDDQTKPTQESINMESLVRCVSGSASPQTQQQALLVMASLADFFPDYMLHNVMSIFTFVGGGLLQQDDNYSLQIITTTLQTIVPALLQAQAQSRSTPEKLDELVASILQVFVDARHAVPKHRCMLVFQTLVETLGAEQYLWMIPVLVMESAARHKHAAAPDDQEWSETGVDADSMFCINIYEQFSARTQMAALTSVLHFLQKLAHHHKTESSSVTPRRLGVQRTGRSDSRAAAAVPVVSLGTLSAQQVRLLQYHLTKLLPAVLQHEAFIAQIVADMEQKALGIDAGQSGASQTHFRQFVQEVLAYMTSVARLCGQQSTKPAQARFWRALSSKVYDILDKVNYLLPTDSLLEVVGSLVTHELVSLRRKALELLANKLQQLEPDSLSREEVKSLLDLLDVLTRLAADESSGSDAEFVQCRQHALFSLRLVTRLLGNQHPQRFVKLYDVVVPLLTDAALPPPLLGVALLCVAELCTALRAHSISKLSAFIPPLLEILKKHQVLLKNEMVCNCALIAVQKMIATLPHFLSPYLLNIILVICELHVKLGRSEDASKKPQSAHRVSAIKQLLCSHVQPRVLIPTLVSCCEKLMRDNQGGLKLIAQVAREHIAGMRKDDLAAQHSALVTFFCGALDLRNTPGLALSWEETGEVEDAFIDAVIAMTVQLPETSFRPMYYKLYDWACREDNAASRNRQLAFFKVSHRLAERLKGLFNAFVGHTMQSMCQVLQANHSKTSVVDYYGSDAAGSRKSSLLLRSVLGCLHQCMLHDSEGFFQRDVFKMLMQPLVDQIDNCVGGDAEYEARMMESVVPCVSQFAVASKDDSAWKSLNYQVILKTRHKSPKVRFGALQVEEAIAHKLGEEFISLLPETIPFLAELMEDEVEEVEQKCQEVIRSIEQHVNEDLQNYF